jgi:hypothetical protein
MNSVFLCSKKSYVFLGKDEKIVCLYDSTIFGGAKEGICLTNKAIHWTFDWNKYSVLYNNMPIPEINDGEDRYKLLINGSRTEWCPMYKELYEALCDIWYLVRIEILQSADLPMRDDAEAIWQNEFGEQTEGKDFTGEPFKKEDYCNQNSLYSWCIEKISQNGDDSIENLQIVNCMTYINRGCKDEFVIDGITCRVIDITEIAGALQNNLEVCDYPYVEKGKKYCIVY